MHRDPLALRQRLAEARLLLVFTPALVATEDEALARLVAAAPWLGLVQVRPKALGRAGAVGDVTAARAARDLARRVLGTLARAGYPELPVIVNDRVDVAAALLEEGVAGVHLGSDDAPPELARALLGADALIGVSTHSLADVLQASEGPADMLGFGPIFATATKGYGEGRSPQAAGDSPAAAPRSVPQVLGAESAWIASSAAATPLFPIGGIDLTNIDELSEVGRAAVGSAILAAQDPGRAARSLYEALAG